VYIPYTTLFAGNYMPLAIITLMVISLPAMPGFKEKLS